MYLEMKYIFLNPSNDGCENWILEKLRGKRSTNKQESSNITDPLTLADYYFLNIILAVKSSVKLKSFCIFKVIKVF